MQNCKEKNYSGLFEHTYKVLCREKNVTPLPIIQMYLQRNYLRFCAEYVSLKDWSPLLNGIMQDQSLSKICVYSRCQCKKIKEKVNTEEKFMKLW
ncbi:unnamed protein product [Lasius platythorax]|uniref:Uncharacterized protein n=1 Tax=Lasius platythorax TaxID=488582 RepID=A0AAV2P8B2_9HYME